LTHTIAVCLVDNKNDFQQLLREDAEGAARKASILLDVLWSGPDLSGQINALQDRLGATPRPDAFLVMAVRDRGIARLVREAARAGIHWLFINRSEDDLEALRQEFPAVAISSVCADEMETGRIQGRIFRALLPAGGKVLYVQGSNRSLAARERTAGVEEVVAGTAIDLVPIEAGWTTEDGRNAVRSWLGIAARANVRLDLVGCQNDLLAAGAITGLQEVARDLGQPAVAKVPVVGCDGAPSMGQAMVKDGRLLATVVLPRTTTTAVGLVARVLAGGERPPALVMLKGESLPDLAALKPISR
jgi:ABC-type sugar transport system substrate-binding protein